MLAILSWIELESSEHVNNRLELQTNLSHRRLNADNPHFNSVKIIECWQSSHELSYKSLTNDSEHVNNRSELQTILTWSESQAFECWQCSFKASHRSVNMRRHLVAGPRNRAGVGVAQNKSWSRRYRKNLITRSTLHPKL